MNKFLLIFALVLASSLAFNLQTSDESSNASMSTCLEDYCNSELDACTSQCQSVLKSAIQCQGDEECIENLVDQNPQATNAFDCMLQNCEEEIYDYQI